METAEFFTVRYVAVVAVVAVVAAVEPAR